MRRIWIAVALCFILVGCKVVTSPEARQEISILQADVKGMTEKLILNFEKAEAVSKEILDTKAAIVTGAADAQETAIKIQALLVEGTVFQNNVVKFRDQINERQAQVSALQAEHGVPGWQLGLNVGLSVLSVLAGSQWIRARTGIGLMVRAVAAGGDAEAIKKRVKKGRSPVVNAAVRRLYE